jgi:hypothetical protein
MATVKRLNTSYTIDTTDVIVTGNLTVLGTQTTLETTDTAINDNLIILNNGETGAGVTKGNAGIIIDRGTEPFAVFGWDEAIDKWVISSDGITFANIASFTGGNVGITAVEDDANPTLGGNLNTLSYEIFSSTDNVTINDSLELTNQPTPANIASSSILYANTIGGGTTGIYVVNDQVVSGEELVTKTRAFGFSLIL